jgi:predicted nucleic acid-binding protein
VQGLVYELDANDSGQRSPSFSTTEIGLQEPEVVAAALEAFRSSKSVGFSDCMVLEIARKTGHLPLGTFDRAFSKMEGTERIGSI